MAPRAHASAISMRSSSVGCVSSRTYAQPAGSDRRGSSRRSAGRGAAPPPGRASSPAPPSPPPPPCGARSTFCERRATSDSTTSDEQRERDGLGASHPARGGASTGRSPGARDREQRIPGDRLRQVVLRLVAELVRRDDVDLVVAEAAVEQRVPEEDLAGRPEAGRVGVGGVRVRVDVLDAHLDVLDALDLSQPVHVGGQRRVFDGLRAGARARAR